jgi:hypothetical protein
MSDTQEVLEHALQRILWELRPYLADIVIIGGWAPYLHRRYGSDACIWKSGLSLTADVDVLITHDLSVNGRMPLAEILDAAGFKPTHSRDCAAVWANAPARGERIEFLVPHRGTIHHLNQVIPIRSQHPLGAISLTALEVMQRHATQLHVPAVGRDGEREIVKIRVPLLGAYLLNKAATFNRRAPLVGVGTNPKRAKDLLYLRDLMAAGAIIVQRLEEEVAHVIWQDPEIKHLVDTAANHVAGVSRVEASALGEAAEMLAERDRMSVAAAHADVQGHLLDLSELLLGFQSPDPAPHADDW